MLHARVQVRESFRWPGSAVCAREVYSLAAANWDAYAAPDMQRMRSHGMLYPVSVSQSGHVRARTESGVFPDTKTAYICPKGDRATNLPPLLLT